ncbi:MAG TPA: aspartyl protease family protein [Terracidiphilus sp.]|nr:aspartyl protease family protein [Terracidiphilus sp.]
MPHFTKQFTNGAPIITAVLKVTQARADALTAANQPIPPMQRMTALVDSGASCTCVDPTIIQALGLSPTGSTLMFTPSTGAQGHTTDQFDASLQIYCTMEQAPLEIPVIGVVASELRVQGIDALIGRDVLKFCLFDYNGASGFFTLAF